MAEIVTLNKVILGFYFADMFACAFEQHREKGVATPLSVALAVYGGYDFTLRGVFF
ncbi:hypothetical protein Hanom_Chr03g00212891 [Helianthus anomalus]